MNVLRNDRLPSVFGDVRCPPPLVVSLPRSWHFLTCHFGLRPDVAPRSSGRLWWMRVIFLRDTLQGIQCDRRAQLAVSISPLSFDHGAFASSYLVRSSSAFASFRTQSLSDWSARSAAASKALFSLAVHITTIGTFRSLDCGFFFAIRRL
jgi:hypothetical protein